MEYYTTAILDVRFPCPCPFHCLQSQGASSETRPLVLFSIRQLKEVDPARHVRCCPLGVSVLRKLMRRGARTARLVVVVILLQKMTPSPQCDFAPQKRPAEVDDVVVVDHHADLPIGMGVRNSEHGLGFLQNVDLDDLA